MIKFVFTYLIKYFEHSESDCQGCLESSLDESITVSKSQCLASLKKKFNVKLVSGKPQLYALFSQSMIFIHAYQECIVMKYETQGV